MNIIKLVDEASGELVMLACGKCRAVWASGEGAGAVRCCDWRCDDCGVAVSNFMARCRDCLSKRGREKEAERLASAKLAVDHKGPVYWPHHAVSGSGGDGYFADLDELIERCDDEGVALPVRVWACNEAVEVAARAGESA